MSLPLHVEVMLGSAFRRSGSIASAIARPDGPQVIDDDAEIELVVLSIFYL